MELILWRHAEAEDGIRDMERRLTAKGVKQADKMAAFLRARLPENSRILVSPAKRTQETAQALTKNFITDPTLAPGTSPQAILKASDWNETDGGCVLIVGHQPTLGEVAALLMADKPDYWSIKKCAVWWFSRREREGDSETTLRLVIAPDFL
jgi:phosphohistidine phosphatase